jgi:hypothetical protein
VEKVKELLLIVRDFYFALRPTARIHDELIFPAINSLNDRAGSFLIARGYFSPGFKFSPRPHAYLDGRIRKPSTD